MHLMEQELAPAVLPTAASSVLRLAKFFPKTGLIRIPIRVTGKGSRIEKFTERTRIEYGSVDTVVFGSALPLELNDALHLQTPDGTNSVEAVVVAMLYCEGGRAIAAKLLSEIPKWMHKS
jgi:hypothetical protein